MYKRQVADRYDLEIEAGNSGTISNVTSRSNRRVVDADGNTVSTITAVSYTHLDVYKRQDHWTCLVI